MARQDSDFLVYLPGKARQHWYDITLQQLVLEGFALLVAMVLLVGGLKIVALVVAGISVYEFLLPLNHAPHYTRQRDASVNRGIRKRNGLAFDPARSGRSAKKNFVSMVRIYDFGGLATLYNLTTQKDTFVIEVSGRRGLMSSEGERYSTDYSIVEMLKMVLSQVGEQVEVSAINANRPFDNSRSVDYIFDHYAHEDVASDTPGTSPGDLTIREVYTEGLSNTVALGNDHVWQFAISVRRPPGWKKYDMPSTGTRPELLRGSSLERLVIAAATGLQTGYRGIRVLDGSALHLSVFKSWNVNYVTQMLTRGGECPYDPEKSEWPESGVWAYPTYIRTGDSYHAILEIDAFQSNQVEPGGFDELLRNRVRWACVAWCSETVSPTVETKFLRYSYQFRDSWRRTATTGGYYETQEDIDKANEPMEALNALYLSRSRAVRFSLPIVISAESYEELEVRVVEMEAILRNLRFGWNRVEGEIQQLRIFFAAVIGTRI